MSFALEHTMLASLVQSRLSDDPNSETRVGPRGRANIIAALSVFSIPGGTDPTTGTKSD